MATLQQPVAGALSPAHRRALDELLERQSCIPVVLHFEETLLCPVDPGLIHQLSEALLGRSRSDLETAVASRLPHLQWRYRALSLLKGLCADPRFAPVLVSHWPDLLVNAKLRVAHLHPAVFATPVFFDQRQSCLGIGPRYDDAATRGLVEALAVHGRFHRIFLVGAGPADAHLATHTTLLALAGTPGLEQCAEVLCRDLREVQATLWARAALPPAAAGGGLSLER